jgi:hypothetical protein
MFLRLYYIFQGFFHLFLSKFKELRYHKLYDERLNICNSCEHNKDNICSMCGCVITAKTKSNSHCSLHKW